MPRTGFLAAISTALILTACSSMGLPSYDPDKGLVMHPSDSEGESQSSDNDTSGSLTLGALFGSSSSSAVAKTGYVVGDEPYAVRAGATILDQGGSAADAAAATYFALAASYPVAAGLGGGGLCVVYDAASGRSQTIDFLARNAARGGAFAVPGNVAGFAVLQAAYGRLPWTRDVALGESLAGAGVPISAALAERLKASQNVVRLDAGLAAEYLDESGQVKAAGSRVVNPALAMTLDAIRQHGANAFYRGAVARKIAAYAAAEGGAVSEGDLAAYRAGIGASQNVNFGNERVYLPPRSVGAGSFAAVVLSQLVDAQGNLKLGDKSGAAARRAVSQAVAQFGVTSLPSDLGATGFAALDTNGQAVACAVTMNGPFGSGHTSADTGVTLATAPSSGQVGLAAAFLTPMVATEDVSGPIQLPGEDASRGVALVGAGAGGPGGTAAIAYALLRVAGGEDMTKPRDLRTDLSAARAAPTDTVNAIVCQSLCTALPDPAAHGAAAAGG
ncbi:MAG: gamma-glutamyltransferase [Pseudomonadota bacterium]|nr:gamma-glutamyltransferase [Pseudomonadota bacterium]